jgi:CBS domain-containing protein
LVKIFEEGGASMKVLEVMMGTPYHCSPETNLGAATELMWTGNCGFLPVVGGDGKVIGVITDRDICVALGTRNKPAGEVTVAEVMSHQVYSCSAEDDVHAALKIMREARVRRLPALAKDGTLLGVISMDDVLVRAEPPGLGRAVELSSDEVVKTFQAINLRQVPQAVAKKGAVA